MRSASLFTDPVGRDHALPGVEREFLDEQIVDFIDRD